MFCTEIIYCISLILTTGRPPTRLYIDCMHIYLDSELPWLYFSSINEGAILNCIALAVLQPYKSHHRIGYTLLIWTCNFILPNIDDYILVPKALQKHHSRLYIVYINAHFQRRRCDSLAVHRTVVLQSWVRIRRPTPPLYGRLPVSGWVAIWDDNWP